MMEDGQLKAEPENVAPPLHNYYNREQEKMNLQQHYHKQTKKKNKKTRIKQGKALFIVACLSKTDNIYFLTCYPHLLSKVLLFPHICREKVTSDMTILYDLIIVKAVKADNLVEIF